MLNLILLFCLAQYLPQSSCQVVIRLYTVANPSSPIVVSDSTILSSVNGFNMNVNSQNYLIVHGFNSNGEVAWALDMKTKLLTADSANANVFVVDWRIGAGTGANYQQAVYNLETSVADVYGVLAKLKEYIQYKDGLLNIHCIGHSLGSHFCGFTSKLAIRFLNLKFERISALDPAGPCFEEAAESKRLSRDDANFVDVIHTSQLLGYIPAIGHADFFPNGGLAQPGCFQVINQILGNGRNLVNTKASIALCRREINFDTITEYIDSNHGRAISLFTESIARDQSQCSFTSYQCGTWVNYLLGRCQTCQQNTMGFFSAKPEAPSSYFLKTRSAESFCQAQSGRPASSQSSAYYCLNSSSHFSPNAQLIFVASAFFYFFYPRI